MPQYAKIFIKLEVDQLFQTYCCNKLKLCAL